MLQVNLLFAWWWIVLGLLAGAVQGLWFHREDWLGGYGSWRRRLTRLGHVAFLGTALLNLAAALTLRSAAVPAADAAVAVASVALLVGAATMPTVCYLAAWRPALRHLFFLPVLALLLGGAATALALTRVV